MNNEYKTSEGIKYKVLDNPVNVGTKGHINHGKSKINYSAFTIAWLIFFSIITGLFYWIFG